MSTVIPASAIRSEEAARSSFFFWLSVLLLSFLLLGFAPTLYLRAFTDPEPIPAYLHVHGIVLTSWYVWLVIQTSMVRTGRTATHRRLGVIGAVIGAAVVFAGPMATIGVVGRLRAAGVDWDTDMSVLRELGVQGVPMLQFRVASRLGQLREHRRVRGTGRRRHPPAAHTAGAQAADRARVDCDRGACARAYLALARVRRRGRAVHTAGAGGAAARGDRPRPRHGAAPSQSDVDRLRSHRARDDRAADDRRIRVWLERRSNAGLAESVPG